MKKRIDKWYRDLEKEIGKEKAKKVEVMFNLLVALVLEGQIEILDMLHGITKQLSDSIESGKNELEDLVKKLRSGD